MLLSLLIPSQQPDLHSTMFIFICFLCNVSKGVFINLHSTMFIFIWITRLDLALDDVFTFHYVYIYIVFGTVFGVKKANLHSTMFIFISSHDCGPDHGIWIYIPLCLYLYCWPGFCYQEFNKIYIPLCLYLY